MALRRWQRVMYQDGLKVYREATDTSGNSLGYQQVDTGFEGADGWIPCQFHGSANYDEHSSPAGSSKTENIMTGNKLSMELGIDIQSMDAALVHLRNGTEKWQSIAGAPKLRPLTNHQYVFGVILGKTPVIYVPDP